MRRQQATWQDLLEAIARDAPRWQPLQTQFLEEQKNLWTNFVARFSGQPSEQGEADTDRRFSASEWNEWPYFDYLRQSYQLTCRWWMEAVDGLPLDTERHRRVKFFLKQYLDACSPANFLATNPEALKKALDTQGQSLQAGFMNLLSDLARGRISLTDESAFEVGRNLALTSGAVVYQNDLIQIIQYRPQTSRVSARPLLMVPPCINKYYILDLGSEDSMVRYALEQGRAVFMVSWRNIDVCTAHLTWDDYVEQGVSRAIQVAHAISGSDQVDTLGFCIGGALLACALAVHERGDQPLPVSSLTLMATLLDYSDVGDIGVYIDRDFVEMREREFAAGGVVPGRDLAQAFSSLRANDLVWPYVVGNYLKGEQPPAFNLLFWNNDDTNLPGPMFTWYLRHFYLQNQLRCPDVLQVAGRSVDLGKIRVPTYIFAAQEDHIVPWKSAFESTRLLSGPVEFVLGASGHIAGSINPASRNRRQYWCDGQTGGTPDEWRNSAVPHPGSWWVHWAGWLDRQSPARKRAPKNMGNRQFVVLEEAPGSYVRVRSGGEMTNIGERRGDQ